MIDTSASDSDSGVKEETAQDDNAPMIDTEEQIKQELDQLRAQFERSVPKFRLPDVVERLQTGNAKMGLAPIEQTENSHPLPPNAPSLALNDAYTTSESNEHTMSIFQYDLMVKEGALWDALDSTDVDVLDAAHSLHVRSAAIAASYAKRNDPPSKETYKESRDMLIALGVPCLSSDGPFEGEAYASALVHAGLADFVATEDTDVIAHEAPMLRGLTSTASPLIAIYGAEVRETLALSREAFVDFILLLGTDFSTRIKNIGPMRALSLVKTHGNIEAALEAGTASFTPAERKAYLDQIALARDVFNNMPAISPQLLKGMLQIEPDKGRVGELLRACNLERAVNKDRIKNALGQAAASSTMSGFGTDFWGASSQDADGFIRELQSLSPEVTTLGRDYFHHTSGHPLLV
ncbi:hypothetical protein BKA62DRAFT_713464 [Auriculariales sp. MPI-PUGE-AT-0066]|nr:hypothetical protein BKA62DRAFT_713464 [Auriculariales sp. MPI-PUGE-AT-0066]